MSQDTLSLSLDHSADLLDAPYYAFNAALDDWLASSPNLTIAAELKPLFLTDEMDFYGTALAPPPSPSLFEPHACSSPESEAETFISSDTDSNSQSPRSTSCGASYRSSSSTSSRIQHPRSQCSQVATPMKRRKGSIPHTEVEKRYRNSLNAELRSLQMAVPHLASFHSELDSGRHRPTKATIIASAVQYIKALELERDALRVGTARAFSGKGI